MGTGQFNTASNFCFAIYTPVEVLYPRNVIFNFRKVCSCNFTKTCTCTNIPEPSFVGQVVPHSRTMHNNFIKKDLYTRQVFKDCSHDPLKLTKGICKAYGKDKIFPLPILSIKCYLFFTVRTYLTLLITRPSRPLNIYKYAGALIKSPGCWIGFFLQIVTLFCYL